MIQDKESLEYVKRKKKEDLEQNRNRENERQNYDYCRNCQKKLIRQQRSVVNHKCLDCQIKEGSDRIKRILSEGIGIQIVSAVQVLQPVVPQPVVSQPVVAQPVVSQPVVKPDNQNIIKKKDHHQEQECSGKDLQKLQMDSYKVGYYKTRKGLQVKTGINIGGVCMNQDCQQFNQLVYFGLKNKQAWNIPRIIEQTVCPVCKKSIAGQIKTIAYYDCSWRVIGKIKGQPSSFKIENKTQKNQVSQYLPNDKLPTVEFAYLMLEADPL